MHFLSQWIWIWNADCGPWPLARCEPGRVAVFREPGRVAVFHATFVTRAALGFILPHRFHLKIN